MIVVTENMAIDGVIEQIDDWFSPAGASRADTSDIEATLREHMEGQGGPASRKEDLRGVSRLLAGPDR